MYEQFISGLSKIYSYFFTDTEKGHRKTKLNKLDSREGDERIIVQ